MSVDKFKFCPYKMHWYEGMPLSPHHFQQNDITQEKTLEYLLSKSMPNHWGVVEMDIDFSNLKQGVISLNHLEAIMPDRSILFFPMYKENPLKIEIDEKKITNQAVPIFITKPNSHTTYESESAEKGYDTVQLESIKDNNNGENSACVFKLKPKYEIHLNEIPLNHTGIQLCSVIDTAGGLQINNYDVPCLDIKNTVNIIAETKRLINLLKEKTIHIKNQINIHNKKYNSSTTNSIFMQGILPVDHMINSKGAHPQELFSALINLIAHISIFSPDMLFQDIPVYHHQHLLKSFKPLFAFIQTVLDNIKEPYALHDFEEKESIFFMHIAPQLVKPEMFLLISYDETANMSEMTKWTNDCIIASESMLDVAVETRVLGIQREYIQHEKRMSDKQLIVKIEQNDRFFVEGDKLFIYNPASTYKPIAISLIEFLEQ